MQIQKSILITGCSSGIGLHCALRCKQLGYRIFATARKKADVEKLKKKGLESLQLDLDSSDSIKKAVKEILKKTDNKLYALFNNGGYGQAGAVEDLNRKTIRKQFETNLFGPLELTNLIIPVMRKQGYGKVIWNSSVLGLVSASYTGAYNSTKYAIEAINDALRIELKNTNIHTTIIEPGPILSKFRENSYLALKQNIDIKNSLHKKIYAQTKERLTKEGATSIFTLPPEAVFRKLKHALNSKKPKVRYYVTFHTYAAAFMKRILPSGWMDVFLNRK